MERETIEIIGVSKGGISCLNLIVMEVHKGRFIFSSQRITGIDDLLFLLSLKTTSCVEDEGLSKQYAQLGVLRTRGRGEEIGLPTSCIHNCCIGLSLLEAKGGWGLGDCTVLECLCLAE